MIMAKYTDSQISIVPDEEKNEEKGRAWPQALAIVVGSMTAFTCGELFAWNSPSIPQITSDKINYNITSDEASYFTVIPPLTSAVSSIIYSKVIDVIGRKYTVLFIAFPQIMAWTLIATTKSVYGFYAARFFTGLSDAGLFASLPVYIGEITTPSVRGTWGNAMTFFIYFGQFVINVTGSYFDIRKTAYISIIIPIIFLCTFIFMPESPYYLLMKNRQEEAKTSLQLLRRRKDVDVELSRLKRDVKRQLSERGAWKDLFTIGSNRRALVAGVFLRASQQFAGISVFAVYTQHIFAKSGGNMSASTASIIFMGISTVVNLCAGFTIDKLGRRMSYISSLIACGIIITLEGIYFYIEQEQKHIDLSSWTWFPVAGMLTFVVAFGFGLGIIPTLMMGELFSASIKGKGLCVLNIVFGFLVALITKVFHLLDKNIGMYCPFLIFGCSCFCSTILAYYFIPETKGKSLEEIQQSLKSK